MCKKENESRKSKQIRKHFPGSYRNNGYSLTIFRIHKVFYNFSKSSIVTKSETKGFVVNVHGSKVFEQRFCIISKRF